MTTNATNKIIVVGNTGVGKTAFVNSVLGRRFDPVYRATLGLVEHSITISDIKYDIWDTVGQDCFGTLRDASYSGASFALVVVDGTFQSQLIGIKCMNNIQRISPMVKIMVCIRGNENTYIPAMLVDAIRTYKATFVTFSATTLFAPYDAKQIMLQLVGNASIEPIAMATVVGKWKFVR